MVTRRKFLSATSLASVAGAMYAAVPSLASAAKDADVKCFGVNACKGKNDCQTASNACAGKGSCQGKGFVKMSRGACDKIGGKAK